MGSVNKPKADKFKKLVLKQDVKRRPATLGEPVVNLNWTDHSNERHIIEYFTVIINDQAKIFRPKDDEFLLAHQEYLGDHSENWICNIDKTTGLEAGRQNLKNVNFVQFLFEE